MAARICHNPQTARAIDGPAQMAQKGSRMDREQAIAEIRARWRELYPADGKGRGKGIICPLCGSGSGPNGTGLREIPGSKSHSLKCFNGTCELSRANGARSIIDIYMIDKGMNPQTDFSRAVEEMAARLNIRIDAAGDRTHAPSVNVRSSSSAPARKNGSETAAAPEAAPAADAGTLEEQPTDYRYYILQCMGSLEQSAEAQAYLQRRGISLETALDHYCGFDAEWKSPTIIKRQREKGSAWEPDPKPCIIIPSSVFHYVARDIRPDLDEQQKKYQKMNEGTPGIFNQHKAFTSGAENIFVTEGAFDALSILEVGKAAIALNSTSNVDSLLDQMKQQPTKATLILCLDKDNAGRVATNRLKEGLQRLNISYVDADICGAYKDPNEALTADRAAFEAAVARAVSSTAARPDNTAEYLDNLMAGEIDRFKQAQDRLTGFANLDEKAGGLNAGLYVLAAISSLGKTTLALQMADQLAAAGHEVLFFSMEQSRLEMVSKSLARITAQMDMKTAVNSLAIRKGYLPAQVTAAARQYKERIGNRLSVIEGNFNADIGFIGDYIRRYKQRTGAAPICFIDYLQIIQPAADGKSRSSKKEEVDLAITELKRLSRELDLTIIVISSINRANYMSPFSFESLKESGQIEFTADVVWGLQLACLDEEIFDKEGNIKGKRKRINEAKAEDPRRIKFVCLKNRYGISSFDCNFAYYPQFDLFIPAAASEDTTHATAKRFQMGGRK